MNLAQMKRETAQTGAFERAILHAPSAEFPKKPGYELAKRLFDVLFSLAFSLLSALPMAAIALWVKLDSRGPVLFRQERLGVDGRPFTMLKFRSMVLDAEKNGPRWAEKYDPRVTRAGRILRGSRMDELPQLWNILRGDMSFVGPRPERRVFYEVFEERIPGFYRRLAVKPGLTGWAQVNGGYELRPPEKIVYDMEYIQGRSLAMDVRCMLMTARIVVTHSGAR